MSNFDEAGSVHNTILDLEILIERPVAQVWTQWLDIGAWVTSHDIVNVQGAPGTLGSITRVSFKRAQELGMALPHHHYCKIIRLDTERQYLLKTFSEKGGSYGYQAMGFDDARFEAVGGGTKVTFHFYGEYRDGAVNKAAALESTEEDNHMWKNLQNLKRMVEGQPRTT